MHALDARDRDESAIIRTATIRDVVAARSTGMDPARLTRVLNRVSRGALRSQLSELAIDAYYGQAS